VGCSCQHQETTTTTVVKSVSSVSSVKSVKFAARFVVELAMKLDLSLVQAGSEVAWMTVGGYQGRCFAPVEVGSVTTAVAIGWQH
jgi:hypothetical protein